MITNFEKYRLITENPDSVWDKEKQINYGADDKEARPFECIVNSDHTEVLDIDYGDSGEYHGDIENRKFGKQSYPGRIWTESKIIAFWVYPNKKLFKSIINKIEKDLELQIFNNDWRIEVVKSDGKIIKKKFNPQGFGNYYMSDVNWNKGTQLIPIEEYTGSENVPDIQRQMHLMNWAEKQRLKEKGIKFAPGFGSDRTAWDKPRNLAYRQSIYQENKKH